MEIGQLYEVTHRWLMSRDEGDFWMDCGPILYLGEDVIERDDGVRIVNHAVLVKGQRRIVDQTFLKYFRLLTTP